MHDYYQNLLQQTIPLRGRELYSASIANSEVPG
jgi:hypothetical protein